MRVKQASSVALFLMFLLLGQSIAANLNQIPSENVDTALDSSAIVMASNNTGGNNTGGNNSGNNSNPANDSHCITVSNFTMTTVYYVTVDLVNICSDAIQYPGVNASASHTGVSGFSNYTNWFYMIAGNDSYNLSWQLSFDQTVTNGTPITLDFEAVVLNCGANNSWSHECPNSTLSHQFIFISTNSGGNNSGNNTGGNNTGGNNSGGNTGGNSPAITVTGATNNSSYQVSSWNFNYSVSNYYGYIDWNATSEDGTLSSSWTSRIYSNSYQTASQENFYQSGNYTVCASINTQVNGSNSTVTLASDCMAIYVYIPPPSLTIYSMSNSSFGQYTSWNFGYSVSNYYGYIYWNATSEDGTLSSSWTSRVYSNSYQTTSQENFYQSGNYTVCASSIPQGSGSNGSSTSSIASDCIDIYVYIAPPNITILDATNSSGYQVTNWNFNYSISNYEGDVYWNATSENGMLYSSWSTYANLTSYQTTSQENFYQSGNYTVCASINTQVNVSNSTVTLASDCMVIYVYIPPPSLTIYSMSNSSFGQYTSWNFDYSVSNYYGYIEWNATSEDGTLSSSWTSRIYSNSYQTTSQENFYQSGNYSVCASINTQVNGSGGSTTTSTGSDCVDIYVYIAPPNITIIFATNSSSNQVTNWNFNYSVSNYEGDVYWNATSESGMLYSSWSTYANLNSWQTTSQENFYQSGNYSVCASINTQVNGSNSTVTLASDCMVIYVYIPQPSLIIYSMSNNSFSQYTSWNFDYSVSNYEGYIYWNATSEDGTLSSSWTSRIYSNSYQTASQENFYQSGNYTVCASISPQGSGSNGSSTSSIASDCETIYVYVPPGPVDCGNTSYILIHSNSSVYNVHDVITFSVLVQCGSGENTFTLRGEVSRINNNQNWSYTALDYYQFSSNLNNTIGNEMYFIFDDTSTSGEYMAQFYIGDASNIIGWVQWNFTVYGDNDVDGINDQFDNCIQIANANQADIDNDGVGDSCDDDIDGDGISNENDDLPNNTNESMDTDGDGIGNNVDTDDDGDGMADSDDAFPLNPTEQADLDGDGVGDNLDADDDADGVTDVTDNCPLIANSDQADLDGDGIGSECDGVELTIDENGTISGDGNSIPSIGMVGTAVAISAGFFIAIRREDEE